MVESITELILSIFNWLGSVTSFVTQNPICLIPIASGVIFTLIGIFRRLTGQRSRRRGG